MFKNGLKLNNFIKKDILTIKNLRYNTILNLQKNIRYYDTYSDKKYAKSNRILLLNELSDNYGARKTAKRVGRGVGSKRGKTSGRGQKGQRARNESGGNIMFEGGQTPFFKRIPKYGFSRKQIAKPLTTLTLTKLYDYIKQGRLDVRKIITMKHLNDSGILGGKNLKYGVRLLANGYESINIPIHLEISAATKLAKETIEKHNGSIQFKYYNRVTLRAHLFPNKFNIKPRRDGIPKPKLAAKSYPDLLDITFLNRK